MSSTASPRPSEGRRSLVREFIIPLAAGGGITAVGGVLAAANDWSTAALWGVAAAGAGVAVVALGVSLAKSAPRIAQSSGTPERDLLVGVATTPSRPTSPDELHPQRVFAISGFSGARKSQIARSLMDAHPEWAFASCGDFVIEEAHRRGIPADLPHTHELGQRLVLEWGASKFLDEVLAHAKVPADAQTLVVDDVYHVPVYEALKKRWDHLDFVFVDLPKSVRSRVLTSRGLSAEEVEEVEKHPLDRAADELRNTYKPLRVIDGAEDEADVSKRSEELSQLFAAAA